MKGRREKLSVIMPAYNEGHHIYNNLQETVKVFEEAGVEYEIILVSDGSIDNTCTESERAALHFPRIKVVDLSRNHGKGHAMKEGVSQASGEIIVLLDADLDLHPRQLDTLFAVMRKEQADVVIGSKRHPESKLDYPLQRRIISNIYAAILFLLFRLPLRDTQSGLKIYRREVLDKVFQIILSKRFAFDVEILANAHRQGYKIVESPLILEFKHPRKWGRMRLRDLYYTGIDTLAIFYRMYILRYYDKQLAALHPKGHTSSPTTSGQ